MLHQHIIESVLKIVVIKKIYCFNLERPSILWSSPGLCFLLNFFILRKPEDRRPASDSRRWPRQSSNFVFREGFDESEIIENLNDLMDMKLLKLLLIRWIWNYSKLFLLPMWLKFSVSQQVWECSFSSDIVMSCISFTKLFYCKIQNKPKFGKKLKERKTTSRT